MEKKRTITFYNDINEPDRELIRENARKTPEELWVIYLGLRKQYRQLIGDIVKPKKQITISRPSWL